MSRNLPYNRADRVADGIKKVIVETVRTELSDPRLTNLNITRVSMTKDLKIARIYFYLIDKKIDDEDCIKQGLESARGFFKKLIAKELNLKFTPDMQFYYDESIDLCDKIDSLFEGKELS